MYHCTVDLLFDWFGLVCFADKKKFVSCHTADSKPVKQDVNGSVILPPWPGTYTAAHFPGTSQTKKEGRYDTGIRRTITITGRATNLSTVTVPTRTLKTRKTRTKTTTKARTKKKTRRLRRWASKCQLKLTVMTPNRQRRWTTSKRWLSSAEFSRRKPARWQCHLTRRMKSLLAESQWRGKTCCPVACTINIFSYN